ncbi:transposase [Thiocapsa sp.]|uniref:transposase n=1 Tax=Thiocapsa sp. TaxID=2024551 RepID=UPI0034584702
MRSSRSKVVTCLGLEWICMALLVPVPWSERSWALPFLTRLAPSKRADEAAGQRHRTVVELTIGMVWLVSRWLEQRRWILLGDGSYSCIQLGWEVLAAQATLVTRLRLDARLFAFPEPVPAGRRGPKPKKGGVPAKLATREEETRSRGEEVAIQWYGQPKTLRLLGEVCPWHAPAATA